MSTILLMKVSYSLADAIAVESRSNVGFANLTRYGSKVYVAPHLIGRECAVSNPPSRRENLVGFVGYLDRNKGVRSFLVAIPTIAKRIEASKFMIIGDGPLRHEVVKEVQKLSQWFDITYVQSVPHSEIPAYLQKMKMIVMPSITEGIPRVLAEAVSCKTVVVATAVGGIPDIIQNELTGVTIKDVSPDAVAEAVITAFGLNLDQMASNAQDNLNRLFSLEAEVVATEAMITSVFERNRG